MANRYYLSYEAENDLEEVVAYIVEENVAAAYKFLDSFYDTLELLSDNPLLGHAREDLTDKPVRFWPFKWHYTLIYKPTSPLEIVRVLSGYRDLLSLL